MITNPRKIYPILGARVCDGILENCTSYGKIEVNRNALLCGDCFNELQRQVVKQLRTRCDA